MPSAPRSLARRYALRDRVNNPSKCGSFAEVLSQLVTWKKTLGEYCAAGAPMPSDEDRRHSLLKMLPGTMSLELMGKAHTNSTFGELEAWVRDQSEFAADFGGKRALNSLEAAQPTQERDLSPEEYDEEEEQEEEELSSETLALMSPSEVNAFVRGREQRRQSGGWQQQRRGRSASTRKPGGFVPRNPRAASAPGPRTTSAKLNCFNCGEEGHRAADCKHPQASPENRPCLNCFKKGHKAADCRQPPRSGKFGNRAAHAVEAAPVAAVPSRQVLACVELPGAPPLRRGQPVHRCSAQLQGMAALLRLFQKCLRPRC